MWIFRRKLLEEIEAFCRKGFVAGEYPVSCTHKARVGSSKLRPWREGQRRDLNGRRTR